jgi:transcriptional regulator with XRE-family HTH domain
MNKELNSEYGERLKIFRETIGKNQTDFGNMLGISRNTLINYESGKTYFDVEFINKLRTALNINVSWLVTGKGKMLESKDEENSLDSFILKFYGENDPDIQEILFYLKDKVFKSEFVIALEVAKEEHKDYLSKKKLRINRLMEIGGKK